MATRHHQLGSNSSSCCFDFLSDDALVAIGSWVAATGAESYAKCLKVNRRFRTVLGEPAVIKQRIRERIASAAATTLPTTAINGDGSNNNNEAAATLTTSTTAADAITTLEHLALWEATHEIGLWHENRIGFDYGSVSIARDNSGSSRQMMIRLLRGVQDEEDDIADANNIVDIQGSRDRVAKISSRILRRFPDCFLRIEAHTGTAAPARIADRFSVARGLAVVRAFLDRLQPDGRGQDNDDDSDNSETYMDDHDLAIAEQRLILTPWGMRISEAAAQSDHRYGRVARQGKGWVEIYVCQPGGDDNDEIEMPPRPAFYNGQTQGMDDAESDDEAEHVIEIYLGGHVHASDQSDEESTASNAQMENADNMGAIEDYEDSDEEE